MQTSCSARFLLPAYKKPCLSQRTIDVKAALPQLHGRRTWFVAARLRSCPLLGPQKVLACPARAGSCGRAAAGFARASAAAAFGSPRFPQSNESLLQKLPYVDAIVQAVRAQLSKFERIWKKFLPMVSLFFFLSFVNTILDSLKDTLVITAVGGGAHVIPYLTVYAVLPSSIIFLIAFSYASQRFSRPALFNGIVGVFMSFFMLFAFFLYPNYEALHPHVLADSMQQVVPQGLAGLVGMFRNWTFTMFFCMSELWGDVCLSLLFWGLANDTTSINDAPTLYPLFGLGANLAQALAGLLLKVFSNPSTSSSSFQYEMQIFMAVVMGLSVVILGLHHYICKSSESDPVAGSRQADAQLAAAAASAEQRNMRPASTSSTGLANGSSRPINARSNASAEPLHIELQDRIQSNTHASPSGAQANGAHTHLSNGRNSSGTDKLGAPPGLKYANGIESGTANHAASKSQRPLPHAGSTSASMSASTTGGVHVPNEGTNGAARAAGEQSSKKRKPTLKEVVMTLMNSVEIRCLAVMSIAQGLCTSLMEFAWKCHIKLLYPSPADFTGFLGDVAMWTGVVTGSLMLISPILFEKLGWKGVANATPQILLWGGGVFFIGCILFQNSFGTLGAAALASGHALAMLQALVIGGALLYIFSKGAKFSLFKPAEEMVYIGMDEQGRTKGKAAIDVVGAQAGKSGGSVLQQALLILSAGAIHGIMPVLFLVFFVFLHSWMNAVHNLAAVHTFEGHEGKGTRELGGMEGGLVGPPCESTTSSMQPLMGGGSVNGNGSSSNGNSNGGNGVGNGSGGGGMRHAAELSPLKI